MGKIPRDCFEDELVPLLEECGRIYDFRLMVDPLTGQNRGYGFCTYSVREEAQDAMKKLDNKEIRPGRRLGVCLSVANNRLFVGSIPKTKTKQEIFDEFSNVTTGLSDVIVYMSSEDKSKNRGFAFLEYENHQAASLARRRLASGRVKVWNVHIVTVDWAEPQDEPDDETMSKVFYFCIILVFTTWHLWKLLPRQCKLLILIQTQVSNYGIEIFLETLLDNSR